MHRNHSSTFASKVIARQVELDEVGLVAGVDYGIDKSFDAISVLTSVNTDHLGPFIVYGGP